MQLILTFFLTQLLAHGSHYLLPKVLWPAQRPLKAWLLQISAISVLYILSFLMTQRPLLASLISLSVLAVFLVVNHAKYQALQEPLVFSDVYLYIQVIRHPRLFLPFLNIPITLAALVAGLGLLVLAIYLEPTYWPQPLSLTTGYITGIISLLLLAGVIGRLAHTVPLSFKLTHDVRTQGFYNSLLDYTLQANTESHRQALQQYIQCSPFSTVSKSLSRPKDPLPPYPHLIAIQSESFFDARRLHPAIKNTILRHFDTLKDEAHQQGPLIVPAWGANTLRSEFAFLSGLDNAALKHYRFNPYQYLQTHPTSTLASHLKTLGYRCIAIHPNSARFFGRDKVFPLFGFDAFIDIDAFDPSDTAGPYISDHAVQKKIKQILNEPSNQQPLFIFVITMENHGPLHLETVKKQDIAQAYQNPPPRNHEDLTVYLRHLANADQMLADLTQTLKQQQRESWLCFYGDHVPSMPKVYTELSFKCGETDYLLWNSHADRHKSHVPATPLRVENLATTLLSYLQARC